MLAAAGSVLIWLICRHAMQPFIDCYFKFNMLYTAEVGLDMAMLLHLGMVFSLMIFPGIVALMISLTLKGKDPLRLLSFWCFAVSFLMLEMSGRDYPHYLIILLPVLAFSFTDLFDWTASVVTKDTGHEPGKTVLILSCLAILIGSIGCHVLTGKKVWPEAPTVTWLKENTDRNDDVLMLGNDAWSYLSADRETGNRFFYQVPPIEISDALCSDFLQELQKHPSDVILDPTGYSDQAEGWQGVVYTQLLRQGYTYQQTSSFSVYQKP